MFLEFSDEYPYKPPKVKFLTKMFHPNIYNDGSICLDILQNMWSPVYDISSILTSIQSLLCDPNPLSPANNEAAELFAKNPKEYELRMDMLALVEFLLNQDILTETLTFYSEVVLKMILIPATVWKVGSPNVKVRKASVICMMRMVDNKILSKGKLKNNKRTWLVPVHP